MEVYNSEEEQVDVVRRFLAENGKAIVIGLLLGLGGLFGWKYWKSHQNASQVQSSVQYESLTAQLAEGQSDSLVQAEKFIQTNNSNYTVFIAWQVAQQSVESGDYKKAIAQLQSVLDKVEEENLRSLIVLRLARVQLQDQQFDQALKTLNNVKGEGWIAQADDIRGDILLKKGDVPGAQAAYSKGIESNANPALQSLMRMKLNNLSS